METAITVEKTCEKCGETFFADRMLDQQEPREICGTCIQKDAQKKTKGGAL